MNVRRIQRLTEKSIQFIRNAEKLALRMDERGFHVAFSGGKDKVTIAPIIDWTDKDVWDFIRFHKMPYCKLYDNGWKRIGCLLCPMANKKEKANEIKQYPRFAEKIYLRAIKELMEEGKYDKFSSMLKECV